MLSESPNLNTEPKQERTIAALDLGSNSFHMVIAEQRHGELRVLETHGEKVQLAAGMNHKGKISQEAETRALECLKRFGQRIRHFEASDVQIVGTNALRVAKNKRSFIAKAQAVAGFPIEVISGREEARLIYLGVAHSMSDDEGRRLVIDIGGGSTEFVIGARFETSLLESLHMGCVSYRDRFFSGLNTVEAAQFDHAVLEASRELLNIKHAYKGAGWDSCVGSSGSIKAVYNALESMDLLTEGLITLDALKQLRRKVLEVESIDALSKVGVKADRVPTFIPGLAILFAAFKVLGIQTMAFNSGALREGLLYDILGRIQHEDVRHRSISSLQRRYHIDLEQSARVESTCLYVYGLVAKKWGIKSEQNEWMLKWASAVYELGTTISHTQHHKHGAYLIQHSDLPGFTDWAKRRLALLIRLHRRRLSKDILGELDKAELPTMLKLVVLFRLAIILTANRISQETDFDFVVKNDEHIVLKMGGRWISEHPLTKANLQGEQLQLAAVGITLDIV